MREPCCSVGYTGCEKNGHIPGGPIWMIDWLPKGYGPSKEDRLLCVFFDTDGRWDSHSVKEEGMPRLVAVVKEAIEKHLREHPEDAAGHLTHRS